MAAMEDLLKNGFPHGVTLRSGREGASFAQGKRPMTPEQERAAEEFEASAASSRSGHSSILLDSPELMTRVSALGEYLRFRSALPPRLSELAILSHRRALAAAVRVGDPRADRADSRHPKATLDALWAGATRRRTRSRSTGALRPVHRAASRSPCSPPPHERARRGARRAGDDRCHRHLRLLRAARDGAQHHGSRVGHDATGISRARPARRSAQRHRWSRSESPLCLRDRGHCNDSAGRAATTRHARRVRRAPRVAGTCRQRPS